MKTEDIVEMLKQGGVELNCEGDNLRVKCLKQKLTDEQLNLIKSYKKELLEWLKQSADTQRAEESTGNFYKEYALPDGTPLKLTEEEFNRVVSVFKLLLQQDQRERATT